jgi:glycosyltransferase involved in cell wall biosynthesis
MKRRVIAVDIRMIKASGIGTYLRGLLHALKEKLADNEELAFVANAQDALSASTRSAAAAGGIYSLREQWTVPRACRELSADLLHSPHYNIPLLMTGRCVVTVHDLIHLKFPQFLRSSLEKAYAHFFFKQVIPRTRAILTVSEHTKRDLMEILHIPGSKITVASPGVPERFKPQSAEAVDRVLKSTGLQKGYFLFVGNFKEFKNVRFLVETYQLLTKKLPGCPPLVLIGRNFMPGFEALLSSIPSIRWLRDVPTEDLPALYSGALALVFPSLYEGFGFPPLEAMACGTCVITAGSASLPEVVGDAGLTIDPTNRDSLLEAMTRLLYSPDLQTDLRQRGLQRASLFSWDALAEKTMAVYRQCLN